MKQSVIAVITGVLISSSCFAADPFIEMSADPVPAMLGQTVHFQCDQGGEWRGSLRSATISIKNSNGTTLVSRAKMVVSRTRSNYDFVIPADEQIGNWSYECVKEVALFEGATSLSEYI